MRLVVVKAGMVLWAALETTEEEEEEVEATARQYAAKEISRDAATAAV